MIRNISQNNNGLFRAFDVMRKFQQLVVIVLLLMLRFYGQPISWHGEFSGWYGQNDVVSLNHFYGIRYLPTITVHHALPGEHHIDFEFSLNAFHSGRFQNFQKYESSQEIKVYRLWSRYSTSQFELRIGLQKINFGSATLFRPLMWFDSLDPRDPLQITSGVYALLLRYYFLNNANIWLWGLLGNKDLRGWEIHPSLKDQPEFGGRIQYPMPAGEVALSFHHRKMQLNERLLPIDIFGKQTGIENRFGVDGKWDLEIGFWLEFTISKQTNHLWPYAWRQVGNIGADYTLKIGNGLNLLAEHFISEEADKAFTAEKGFSISGVSFSYPIGIMDQLQGIFYYDWKQEDYYRFFNWRRIYDRLSFFLMLFWNPETTRTYSSPSTVNNFAGKGFQIMVVFDH